MTRTDRRHAATRAVVLLFVLTIGASIALLAPVTSASTSHAAPSSTTVTSSVKAWQWDPSLPNKPGAFYDDPRSVTVDQTADLVSQIVHVIWKNFSASSTSNSAGPGNYPVHLYECDSADPTDPGGCYGDLAFGDKHPGYGLIGDQTNLIQTYTGTDGTGSADFDVLTGADNPALGCGPTHQCSLVVVPWAGGKPAIGHQPADCNDHSLDLRFARGTGFWALPAGQPLNRGCDWDSRIVIPLSFAPTPLNCPARDSDFSSEGSPMMRRAVDQWRAGVCNGGGGRTALQVQYTGLSEYQARSDFDRGAIDLGMTSQPASGLTRTFSYAPLGVTSVAIAYYVDDPKTGRPITDLKLNARLLAKLLTQSYTDGLSTDCANPGSYACAPEDAGNPSSIFQDQEFLQLNPQYDADDFPFTTQGNSSPDVVYGLSDNTHQITQWIESDKDAADFLAGKRDPWGTHVNTAYLPSVAPAYPLDSFNANDPGHTLTNSNCGTLPQPIGQYSCVIGGLQNNWFPINGLDNVAKTLVGGKNTAKLYTPSCDGNNPPIRGVCTHYVGAPAEPLGTRGVFAIVPGGDDAAFQFPTAQLETKTGSGRFVSLSNASMTAALGDMKTNSDGVTQHLDYATLNDPDAYPLTTVSYGMAPTCGLTSGKAAALASYLDYVASDVANTLGVQPGQLAPGYLPMTDAMRTTTHDLAAKVAAEPANCGSGGGSTTPPAGGTTTAGSSHHDGAGNSGATGAGDGAAVNNGGSGVGGLGGITGPTGTGPSGAASSSGPATPRASASPSASPSLAATPAGKDLPLGKAGAPALFLPVTLCLGAALLLGGPALLYVNKRGLPRRAR